MSKVQHLEFGNPESYTYFNIHFHTILKRLYFHSLTFFVHLRQNILKYFNIAAPIFPPPSCICLHLTAVWKIYMNLKLVDKFFADILSLHSLWHGMGWLDTAYGYGLKIE